MHTRQPESPTRPTGSQFSSIFSCVFLLVSKFSRLLFPRSVATGIGFRSRTFEYLASCSHDAKKKISIGVRGSNANHCVVVSYSKCLQDRRSPGDQYPTDLGHCRPVGRRVWRASRPKSLPVFDFRL